MLWIKLIFVKGRPAVNISITREIRALLTSFNSNITPHGVLQLQGGYKAIILYLSKQHFRVPYMLTCVSLKIRREFCRLLLKLWLNKYLYSSGLLHWYWDHYTRVLVLRPIDMLRKSHNTPVWYPTMHHCVTEMCTCVHIFVVTEWCTVGYLFISLRYLWDGSVLWLWQYMWNNFERQGQPMYDHNKSRKSKGCWNISHKLLIHVYIL